MRLHRLLVLISVVASTVGCCPPYCVNPQPNLPTNGAAAIRWNGYIDTDFELASFYATDFTLTLRFMAQYERAYEGPLLANTGSGTFLVEMGDYGVAGGKVNLVVKLDGAAARYVIPNPAVYPADYPDYLNTTSAPSPPVLPWRHLAIVKSGSTLSVWLDGQHLLPDGGTSDLPIPASAAPTGRLRLGKRVIGSSERETQFYGLIDDLGLFDFALTDADISGQASQSSLTGNEHGLRAGLVFQNLPSGTPAPLQRGYTLQGSSYVQEISATKNIADDNKKLPMPTQQATYRLPFKYGEVWQVLQAFNSYGSHGGYAAFCWDFIRVPRDAPTGQPQIDALPSEGRIFVSAAAGTVEAISLGSGAAPSYVQIKSGNNEYHGSLHFKGSSLKVAINDVVNTGSELADVSNVGGGGPHLHFGVSNRLETQHDQLVTFPIYFSGYKASDDYGKTWYDVPWGMPRVGQWIRHDP